MAVTTPFPLSHAALGPAMSLIVEDREGEQYEVKTAGDAAQYLAAAWSRTLEELDDRELVAYTPEVVIRAREGRALAIAEDLHEENEIVAELLADEDWPRARPSDVSGDLYFYAVVSDTQAGRIAMIKKKNPTKRARNGKGLFAAGDELRALGADPWELDPLFDVVVGVRGGYVLNTHYFEQLFADADRLRARIKPWVTSVAKQLPMSKESRELLVAACEESPRMRRRLRTISHRNHIERVTIEDVRRHVREMDLKPSKFLKRTNCS